MLARLASRSAAPVTSISPPERVRTRSIVDSDLDAVARLLVQGFRRSTSRDWMGIFGRLATHQTPAGFPRYGYLMESDGAPVGVILLVSSSVSASDASVFRCNLSSWYVLPAYRGYGHLFISKILKKENVTYINVSPAPHTIPLLKVQGFARYNEGQFLAAALPFQSADDRGTRVVSVDNYANEGREIEAHELLLSHAQFGCISLWCIAGEHAHPFVFRRRVIKGVVPCAQLIYCRNVDEFVQFSRPIGRFLARHGMPLVMIDSNGRIPGLVGIYVRGMLPKYYKGSLPPRLGDLAYTESALFGI
jgi:hypothetical protein